MSAYKFNQSQSIQDSLSAHIHAIFHEFMSSVQTQCDYTNTHRPVQINYIFDIIFHYKFSNLETFHIAPMVQHYLQYTVYV